MAEIEITRENFEAEVLNSDKPVMIDFWATWCGPCRMVAPIIEEIAQEYGDAVKVGKVNVDDEDELASEFKITSIPTIVLMKGGKVENTIVGYRSKEDIVKLFGIEG